MLDFSVRLALLQLCKPCIIQCWIYLSVLHNLIYTGPLISSVELFCQFDKSSVVQVLYYPMLNLSVSLTLFQFSRSCFIQCRIYLSVWHSFSCPGLVLSSVGFICQFGTASVVQVLFYPVLYLSVSLALLQLSRYCFIQCWICLYV